jgi:protein-L-isoaspartate(D-aspartate) O-methyltransferase
MTTTPGTDAVARAAAQVPAARFHGPDGKAVRPCTPADVTSRHLRMLDVHPGQHVLEVGTGSGYSAALLAHLTGADGQVTTIDIDENLHERARALYEQHGHPVLAVRGDGLPGYPDRAPFDRIFVGTTPPAIPAAWLEQLADHGRLITGCRISPLPGSYAVAHVVRHGDQFDVTAHAGGYTPMILPTAPDPGAGLVTVAGADNSDLTTATSDDAIAHAWLAALRSGVVAEAGLEPGEFLHVKNWLLATAPDGLFTATTEHGTGIGVGSIGEPSSAAMLTAAGIVASRDSRTAADVLATAIDAWRAAGSPATDEMAATLTRQQNHVRVRLTPAGDPA